MDRPDLIARVFHQKVKELKAESIVKAVFRKCAAYVHVVEFQKQGLSHAHMLFWLEKDSKIRDADDVDKIVSAEIPDKTRYPLLHDIVKQCMIHDPFSQQNVDSPCMDTKTNRCEMTETLLFFMLREMGHVELLTIETLCRITRHDCAIVGMENVQEDCNIILAVHVEGEQVVYFEEGNEEVAIDENKESTLLAWFTLNTTDVDAQFTKWSKRKKFVKPVLSRMYFVSPKETERYFLRMLLSHIRGAQSFQDVRTNGGIMYPTDFEAAVARKLVTDDEEWDKCLSEASSLKFPTDMCRLFAYICVFSMPINARQLFEKYKSDFVNHHEYNEQYEQKALQAVKVSVNSLTKNQGVVFNAVMAAVRGVSSDKCICLDGLGSRGKSYLHDTIISTLNSENIVVLPVAWTGIAAHLLKGGRTAHLTFKLPFLLNEQSTCKIRVCDGQTDSKQRLLKIGDGVFSNSFEFNNEVVAIPTDILSKGNIVQEIFSESIDPQDLSTFSKVILAPTNTDVIAINNEILSKIKGSSVDYLSVDRASSYANISQAGSLKILK
ncbi:uncharacterized protein LOC124410178 [Diprion similis]|uniref:uncharacterized protein LOC124410178 n=1 Tax=Diprion similis TaxID=362088 RepID=UPI001EF7CA58|nr:uncharacterized protein LOC124410178 [Diprion similis]